MMGSVEILLLTQALLSHKDIAQGTQSPILEAPGIGHFFPKPQVGLWPQYPIRAQYLAGSRPMRVDYSAGDQTQSETEADQHLVPGAGGN